MASRLQINAQVLKLAKGGKTNARLLAAGLFMGTYAWAHAADYRATPEGKLDAAREHVKQFLIEDANPDEVYFARQVVFPVWKDHPIYDCGLRVLVRAIAQRGEPRFESRKQDVVLVPVVAELLMVEAGASGGPDEKPGVEGANWCSFEYERYNFASQRFELVPDFLTQTHNISFRSWGETLNEWRPTPLPEGVAPNIIVAVDADKRYVRYTIRVRISRDKPYRIWPQVPRHWYAGDAITKLERSRQKTDAMLAQGGHDLWGRPSIEEIEQRQRVMRVQNQDRDWKLRKLRQGLETLKRIEPFSDISIR